VTPSWLLDLVAAIMLVVAAASAARLVAIAARERGSWRPVKASADADVTHALMGIAMAGMLTASLTTLPNGTWDVIFGVATAWFATRVGLEARGAGGRLGVPASRCVLHLAHSAAMLYMFVALSAPAAGGGGRGGIAMGGSAMGTLQYPTLAGAFTLLLIGYSVWDLDQLSGGRCSPATAGDPAADPRQHVVPGQDVASLQDPAARAFLLAPATQVGWQVVLGVAMAFMLVIMI
jgi:hypothetical protein